MALSIRVAGLDAYGVELLSPTRGADDDSRLSDLFSAYVQAKQDWYRGIIEALDAGHSVAESFAPVERYVADVTKRMHAGNQLTDEKPADMWIHQAAAESRRWRRWYRDEDIPSLLNQAIRLNPFTIRRGDLRVTP